MSSGEMMEQENTENTTVETHKGAIISEVTDRPPFTFADSVYVVTNQHRKLTAVAFLQVDPLYLGSEDSPHATATAKVLLPIDVAKQLVEAVNRSIAQIENEGANENENEGET